MITGRILHLQRLSTEDGPGIRTTVFFKGCPLHCAWCHNPESLSSSLQTQWFSVRCIGCQTCVKTCPNGCLTMTAAGLVIDRERCEACGKCAEACPSGALEALGRTVYRGGTAGRIVQGPGLLREIRRRCDPFGRRTDLPAGLCRGAPARLKEQGIATALDTCGLCSPHTLDRLLPYTDLVLFDLKLFAPALHRQFTGVSNEQILENLDHIRDSSAARRIPSSCGSAPRSSQGQPRWTRT